MTFNFLGPGLTVNVEAKVKEQIILDSSGPKRRISQSATRLTSCVFTKALARTNAETFNQITGSPKVAIAGFAFKIPVSTRPQIKSIEVT